MTQAFNLSQFANKVNTSGQASLTTAVTGTLPVTNGGIGTNTLTTAYGVLAAGTTATGAVQNIGTGTANQVLTSNGPGALPTFQAAAGGGFSNMVLLPRSPGTWTVPTGVTKAKVTLVGGGAGGGGGNNWGGGGGGAVYVYSGLTPGGSVPYTIGAGGAGGPPSGNPSAQPSSPGGTTSIGPAGTGAVTVTASGGSPFGGPGVGSGGTLNVYGINGIGPVGFAGSNPLMGGNGSAPGGAAVPSAWFGVGGGGNASPNFAGFAGAAGAIVIEY